MFGEWGAYENAKQINKGLAHHYSLLRCHEAFCTPFSREEEKRGKLLYM